MSMWQMHNLETKLKGERTLLVKQEQKHQAFVMSIDANKQQIVMVWLNSKNAI